MKNIQIIDGARNCAYDVYEITDEDFKIIFPDFGQDIEFAEDLGNRLDDKTSEELSARMWVRRLNKPEIQGIHGTLFYQLQVKKQFYPNKRESDLDKCLKNE